MMIIDCLPSDWLTGQFLGRLDLGPGPSPVLISEGKLYDLSRSAATVASCIERNILTPDFGHLVCDLTKDLPSESMNWSLLPPIDLQVIKAAGVTFAQSAIERVIEERARGDADAATAIRTRIEARLSHALVTVVPGSQAAQQLKDVLIADGLWSQYLEVAFGPDAEIFTKAPVLSSVGHGSQIGVRSDSDWNNPEPEIVLIVDSRGTIVGATLGNDVNLRDFEGRSALLLGKAKDNNASCAIGPLIRLIDDGFTLDEVRRSDVTLTVEGLDDFVLHGKSSMGAISRDPVELVRQALSEHQYPDGFCLFLGTLFAPVEDRDEPGRGFTHHAGDVVTIASKRLGMLRNIVTTSKDAPAWDFGLTHLMRNLNERGLSHLV